MSSKPLTINRNQEKIFSLRIVEAFKAFNCHKKTERQQKERHLEAKTKKT